MFLVLGLAVFAVGFAVASAATVEHVLARRRASRARADLIAALDTTTERQP
jgi:hypothetical protein